MSNKNEYETFKMHLKLNLKKSKKKFKKQVYKILIWKYYIEIWTNIFSKLYIINS